MNKISELSNLKHISFMCPGCKEYHSIRCNSDLGVSWTWNNDRVKPTFSPSILVTGSKLTDKGKEQMEEWKNSNYPKRNEQFDSMKTVCHSFINNGNIQFLDDCTHELKGKTVELPECIDKLNNDNTQQT